MPPFFVLPKQQSSFSTLTRTNSPLSQNHQLPCQSKKKKPPLILQINTSKNPSNNKEQNHSSKTNILTIRSLQIDQKTHKNPSFLHHSETTNIASSKTQKAPSFLPSTQKNLTKVPHFRHLPNNYNPHQQQRQQQPQTTVMNNNKEKSKEDRSSKLKRKHWKAEQPRRVSGETEKG